MRIYLLILIILFTGCAATKKFIPGCNKIYVYTIDEWNHGEIVTYLVTKEYRDCKCIYVHKERLTIKNEK